ncbi:MAG: TIR domain-containing protein [Gammaproteobacteria bacterium]
MKPRVFIASSTEARDIAHSLENALQIDAQPTVWDQNVFGLGKNTLQSLLERVDCSDFGVFVFSPDDIVRIHDKEQFAARDNIVFELGVFVGKLGPRHSFLVVPQDIDIRIPSDLWGVTVAKYNACREDKNLDAATWSGEL